MLGQYHLWTYVGSEAVEMRRAYHGKKRALLSMTTAFFVLAWGGDCDATQRAWAVGELEVWRLVPVSLGLALCLSLSLSCQAHARLLGTCSCPCPPPRARPTHTHHMAVDLVT